MIVAKVPGLALVLGKIKQGRLGGLIRLFVIGASTVRQREVRDVFPLTLTDSEVSIAAHHNKGVALDLLRLAEQGGQ